MDQYERNTVVTVRRCERRDTGRYRLLLSNSSGQADTQADGVVLGRPSKPQVRTSFKIAVIFIKMGRISSSKVVVMIGSNMGRMSSKRPDSPDVQLPITSLNSI